MIKSIDTAIEVLTKKISNDKTNENYMLKVTQAVLNLTHAKSTLLAIKKEYG